MRWDLNTEVEWITQFKWGDSFVCGGGGYWVSFSYSAAPYLSAYLGSLESFQKIFGGDGEEVAEEGKT